jgi:hypothetical protein
MRSPVGCLARAGIPARCGWILMYGRGGQRVQVMVFTIQWLWTIHYTQSIWPDEIMYMR